jgi:hypothetical protein
MVTASVKALLSFSILRPFLPRIPWVFLQNHPDHTLCDCCFLFKEYMSLMHDAQIIFICRNTISALCVWLSREHRKALPKRARLVTKGKTRRVSLTRLLTPFQFMHWGSQRICCKQVLVCHHLHRYRCATSKRIWRLQTRDNLMPGELWASVRGPDHLILGSSL